MTFRNRIGQFKKDLISKGVLGMFKEGSSILTGSRIGQTMKAIEGLNAMAVATGAGGSKQLAQGFSTARDYGKSANKMASQGDSLVKTVSTASRGDEASMRKTMEGIARARGQR